VEYVPLHCSRSCSNLKFSELKKGSKRVAWQNIKQQNDWYISSTFLLPNRVIENPTRLGESDLRAYWKLWYRLSQSGQNFTFKRVGSPGSKADSNPGSDGEGENEVKEKSEPEGGRSKEPGSASDPGSKGEQGGSQVNDQPEDTAEGGVTPDQCHSDGAQISFLRTLNPDYQEYQVVIDLLAQMRVSSYYHSAYI
jgi:hypothetical protein